MSDNSNGWSEYKKLFEADREENSNRFKEIEIKLADISESLIRIETQRDSAKWIFGFIIPVVVSGIVGAIAAYLR